MSPLTTAELAVDGVRGTLLLHACPGILGRQLDTDLEGLLDQGGRAMLTLVPSPELGRLGLPAETLARGCGRRQIDWRHRPIDDMGVPDRAFAADWPETVAWIDGHLRAGRNVAIHCRAGLGRTGMIAARFLVEQGMAPATAIGAVRAVRPGAIETPDQVRWVASGGGVVSEGP